MKSELYSIYIATMLLTSTVATPSFASPTTEDIPAGVSQTEGLYAGTFFCSSGEMGITMSLKDQGVANPDKSDIHKRLIGGVINFFPTVINPTAPTGAFEVDGTADYSIDGLSQIKLNPGKWLLQPESFGASGIEARIIRGNVFGKPTANGCYTLKMVRIQI